MLVVVEVVALVLLWVVVVEVIVNVVVEIVVVMVTVVIVEEGSILDVSDDVSVDDGSVVPVRVRSCS